MVPISDMFLEKALDWFKRPLTHYHFISIFKESLLQLIKYTEQET